MASLFFQLRTNRRLRRINALLPKIDAGMAPLVEKYGLRLTKTVLNSRAQATLQLAYRDDIQNLRFYTAEQWAVGIYEMMVLENRQLVSFMTVYIHLLQYSSPHLYFDNKANNKVFDNDFPEHMNKAQLVSYDGFISQRFNLYAPEGYAIDSLVVGAPDVLDAIDRCNMGADIELVGNQLYLIFPDAIPLHDKLEELMTNGATLAKAINDNLSRYKDERAISAGQTIGQEGRRLIRR